MHDTLSPSAHGLLDYITVLVFALAPTLFQFDGVPALVAYGLAGAHLVLTLTTRFPMGMFDGVPLRAHGVVELVVSAALIVLPWVAGFIQPGAQWFFPIMGIYVFVVWLLSDYGRLAPVGETAGRTDIVPPAESDSIPGGRDPEAAVGPGDEERRSLPDERDVEKPRPPDAGEGGRRPKHRGSGTSRKRDNQRGHRTGRKRDNDRGRGTAGSPDEGRGPEEPE